MSWSPVENGKTIGERGSESGIIVVDSEYQGAARISLERDGDTAPYAITCGIYGWMVHTRFFSNKDDAEEDLGRMKNALAEIVDSVPPADPKPSQEQLNEVVERISRFVERFP